MPIYEYQCPDCGHRFDKLQKVSDDPVRICPHCGQEEVKKLVSASAFILKGSGWYKDHYGLKPGGADTGGSGSGPAKVDAPAPKPESSAPAANAPAASPASPSPSPSTTTSSGS